MNKRLYVVLAGLPGSGKSTFVNEFLLTPGIAENWAYWEVLSTDAYIEDIAKAAGKTYNEVFADEIENATLTTRAYRDDTITNTNFNILHDQTNLTPKKRHSIVANLSPKKWTRVCVYFQCEEAIRQRRLACREGKTIPRGVDLDMQKQWQWPTLDEDFDLITPNYAWKKAFATLIPALTGAACEVNVP